VGREKDAETRRYVATVVLVALLASVLNTAGGLIFNSRLLIVNGLTCIANFLVAIANVYFYRRQLEPEDVDHPMGHAGYSLSASVTTLLVYAFVLGLGIDEVLNPSSYSVSGSAWIVPLVVALMYSASVLMSRRLSGGFLVYSNVTTSEIAESLVALVALPFAHAFSFEIDRAAAAGMLSYLAYQVAINSKGVIYKVTGPAPPPKVYSGLLNDVKSLGVKVKDLKLRSVGDNYVSGYIVVEVPPAESVKAAHELADRIESLALTKYNMRLVVHVEPEET